MINTKLIYKVLRATAFHRSIPALRQSAGRLSITSRMTSSFIVATLTTIGGGLVLKYGEDTEQITQCRAVMPISW